MVKSVFKCKVFQELVECLLKESKPSILPNPNCINNVKDAMYKSNKHDELPEMLDLALVNAKTFIIFNKTAHFEN